MKKSRTSSTGNNVMEGTQQPLQIGGGVNPSWWSIRPSSPPVVSTITSCYQQHHHQHPSYNLLLQPSDNNKLLPFNPPINSIVLSPYSPQPTSSSNSSSWHEQDNNNHHHHHQSATKLKMHDWEESQVILQQQQQRPQQNYHFHDANYESNSMIMDIKQENHSIPSGCFNCMFGQGNEELEATAAWSSIVMPPSCSSPPKSCVTSFGNNNSMLDFSSNSKGSDGTRQRHHPAPEHPLESNNSSATGGASKKARVQPSTPQSNNTFKVRKEKLGDRITALHQLVSPFGKTDTASVLLETMGYIRFLQSQIEALSLPYLGSGGGLGSTKEHQQQQLPIYMHAHGESICIFPEDPGQLLNDIGVIKRKASSELQDSTEKDLRKLDLKSRGLCLVPVSCTLQVGSDNGADYWAPPPALGGGFR